MAIERHKKTALTLAVLVVAMLGGAYASVPLYRLFCQVTGFDGTPMRAEAKSHTVTDRTMIVRFDANVAPDLPWGFKPEQTTQTIKIGENRIAYYKAVNRSDRPVTGTAVFNVTPEKAGAYFRKVQCFCFENQTLKAGQAMDMPVLYYIDPEWVSDPDMADVREVTLSYTFFAAKTDR